MTALRPGLERSVPRAHAARSHPQLLRSLATSARTAFVDAEKTWDPSRERRIAPDPGRGVLDCFALPLHVLWTYQEAWAREGFLPTLQLGSSRARLLELVAPPPTPGMAATGLQHFRCKPNRRATLPPGFRLTAPAAGGRPEATFETLTAADTSFERNSFLPFLPGAAGIAESAGAIAVSAELLDPDVLIAPPGADFLPQLERRIAAGRAGDTARRNAERLRTRALQRAETLTELQNTGAIDPFSPAFQQLCEEVCEAQRLANEVPPDAPVAPLSEAQELLLGQLGRMARRHPDAMDGLNQALARKTGESHPEWTARLDQTANFLDALVTGLLQEARDQVARLHGPGGLDRLDRAYRDSGTATPAEPDRGRAEPGTDSVFLLSSRDGPTGEERTQADFVRPGDWLVVAETVDGVTPEGDPEPITLYREAVRVTRVRDEVPDGQDRPLTRIVFEPALGRAYRLSSVSLLGNMVPISHGTSVRRTVDRSAISGRGMTLTDEPLTWLPDPRAAGGRATTVSLRISGQDWQQVPQATADQAPPGAFFLSVGADGVARIAIGAGDVDAPIPPDARIDITYRTGAGPDGLRDGGDISELATAHSAIAGTFNPLPTRGGVAAETPEEAQEAGIGASILDRAVSVADVRLLALSYGTVRRAQVFRDALRARERLTVVVSGRDGAALEAEDLNALHAFLAARVAPGVVIRLENRRRADLRARVRLGIVPGGNPLQAIAVARRRLGLERVEHEAPGLLDPDRSELGRDVHLSDLHGALAGIPDVALSHVEALYRAGSRPQRADRVDIASRELPLWAGDVPDREPVEIRWEEARDLP